MRYGMLQVGNFRWEHVDAAGLAAAAVARGTEERPKRGSKATVGTGRIRDGAPNLALVVYDAANVSIPVWYRSRRVVMFEEYLIYCPQYRDITKHFRGQDAWAVCERCCIRHLGSSQVLAQLLVIVDPAIGDAD